MSSSAERPGQGEPLDDWRGADSPAGERLAGSVRDALDRWGSGFLAYLLLPDVDPAAETLERDYVDTYAGWYPDRTSLIRAQLENLGWTDALAAFRTGLGLPPAALDFNDDHVWQHCLDVYDVVERLPGVHAFLR